jgi:hypothetical protein
MRHTEDIAKIEAIRAVPEGESFIFELDVTTGGGVRKTLRMGHYQASMVASLIRGEVDSLEPEVKKRSFQASMERAQ